jgi:hypothetical protein
MDISCASDMVTNSFFPETGLRAQPWNKKGTIASHNIIERFFIYAFFITSNTKE